MSPRRAGLCGLAVTFPVLVLPEALLALVLAGIPAPLPHGPSVGRELQDKARAPLPPPNLAQLQTWPWPRADNFGASVCTERPGEAKRPWPLLHRWIFVSQTLPSLLHIPPSSRGAAEGQVPLERGRWGHSEGTAAAGVCEDSCTRLPILCFFFFGKREKLPFCDTALDFTAQDHIFGVQYKKKKTTETGSKCCCWPCSVTSGQPEQPHCPQAAAGTPLPTPCEPPGRCGAPGSS